MEATDPKESISFFFIFFVSLFLSTLIYLADFCDINTGTSNENGEPKAEKMPSNTCIGAVRNEYKKKQVKRHDFLEFNQNGIISCLPIIDVRQISE